MSLRARLPVTTVCRSGGLSVTTAGQLAGGGREVLNLRGGIRAWQLAALPVIGEEGRPGIVR